MARGHRFKERSRHKVKGPWMPSFEDQRGGHRHYAFKPGTQGLRQVKRNLRNKCRHILDSHDQLVLAAGDRILRGVAIEPDPEYSALHLFCVAVEMHDDTGEAWHTCANYIMDQFEEQAREAAKDGATKAPSQERQREGGFFRGFLARVLRSRDARAPEGHEHQRAGDEHGEPQAGAGPGAEEVDRGGPRAAEAPAGQGVPAGR